MDAGNALAVIGRGEVVRVDKTAQSLAIRRAVNGAADYVEHLGLEEVLRLAAAAEANGRGKKGQRDRLMVETLFDGCLRVSEGLRLRPMDLIQSATGWEARIMGKGNTL